MSFHTITIMIRWIVTADNDTRELLNKLKLIPFNNRQNDPKLIETVQSLKQKWSIGTKIERLATLGWCESVICKLFSEMLENLDILQSEYEELLKIHGKPPELNDKDLDKFENAINEEKNIY